MIILLTAALACPPSTNPYLSIEQGSACLAFPGDQNPWTNGGSSFGTYYGTYGDWPDPEEHWIRYFDLQIENTCADAVAIREPGCTDCFFDVDIAPGATVVVDVPEPPEMEEVVYVLEVTEGKAVVDIVVTAKGGETIPCGTGDTGGTEPTPPGDTNDTGSTATLDDTGTDDGSRKGSGCGCAATATPAAAWWPLRLLQRRSTR